jgi:glutaredoxin-related protein
MSVTKVMIDPNHSNRRNRQRIEAEEKELEELMKVGEQEENPAEQKPVEVEQEPSDPEEKSFKKRYGDLRRHMAEKEKEWEAKFEALKASTQTTQILPPKSDEDIAAWAKKYPDVAAIVETIALKKADEKLSNYKDKFAEYEKVTQETVRQKAFNAIRDSHPDFDELRKSDKFHEWADDQPKWVQDALYENEEDARAVVRVLDLYKSDMGMTTSARKAQTKEAASLVTSKNKANMDFEESGAKILESQVARMSANEYEKNEKKIMEAIRKGNFVYDLSGGAR